MGEVRDGADVYSYAIAILLRRVERYYPEFIRITKAQHAPEDGAQEQPYFGAILTAEGKAIIERPQPSISTNTPPPGHKTKAPKDPRTP